MRQARAETLRKYEILHKYVSTRDSKSMFSQALVDEDRQYVLLGLSSGECQPDRDLLPDSVSLRGWADIPGQVVPPPRIGDQAAIQEWTRFSRTHERPMRACILEWILLDPRRAPEFIKRLSAKADIRSWFGGYFTTIAAVMGRLGVPEPETPPFLAEKIERLCDALKSMEKWLESARRELTARENRVKYFQTTLWLAKDRDWDAVVGYESQIPALPPQPPTRRTRKVPRAVRTSTAERVSWNRKRSISRTLSGVRHSCLT